MSINFYFKNSSLDKYEEKSFEMGISDRYEHVRGVTSLDLNNDGLINVTDIVLLVDWILSGNFQQSGDINQDDYMNVTDIVMLIDLILNP